MIFLPRLTPLQLRSLMIAVIILVSFTLTMDSAGQTPAGSPTTNEQQQAAKKSGEQQADDVIRISTNLVQVDVIVTDGKGQHVTNLKPTAFQRIKTEGVVYQSDFPITKPGTYQFRAVLRESSSGKLGSASQMVEIPDLSKARLALSGLILAGTSGTVHDSPTRRQFALNSELIYGALAYIPLRDPLTGQAQMFSQIEIYHDGKVIHQSTPRAVEASGTPTTTESEIGGRLQLKGLEAGDYFLRLLVTDSLGSGKFARAEQWMDFSIRK